MQNNINEKSKSIVVNSRRVLKIKMKGGVKNW